MCDIIIPVCVSLYFLLLLRCLPLLCVFTRFLHKKKNPICEGGGLWWVWNFGSDLTHSSVAPALEGPTHAYTALGVQNGFKWWWGGRLVRLPNSIVLSLHLTVTRGGIRLAIQSMKLCLNIVPGFGCVSETGGRQGDCWAWCAQIHNIGVTPTMGNQPPRGESRRVQTLARCVECCLRQDVELCG